MVPPFHEVADPARASRSIRDLYRTALSKPAVSMAVATLVQDGEHLGHKALVWDNALRIVEGDLGAETMAPFADDASPTKLSRYERATKLRSVYRERVELSPKNWSPVGVASRLLRA